MPKVNEIIWFLVLALVALLVYDLFVKRFFVKTAR